MRRRRDALDDEFDMLQQWMPSRRAYDDYVDFAHCPIPTMSKHAVARQRERKHLTGCLKAKYVPGTNKSVVATVVPCRAQNATTRMRAPTQKYLVRKHVRRMYAAAKAGGAKANQAQQRLQANIEAVRPPQAQVQPPCAATEEHIETGFKHPTKARQAKVSKRAAKQQKAAVLVQLAEAKRGGRWDEVDEIEAKQGRSLQMRLKEAKITLHTCTKLRTKARWRHEIRRLQKKLGYWV